MLERIRTRAVWMAAGLVLGGGALASAGIQATSQAERTIPPVKVEKEAADKDRAKPEKAARAQSKREGAGAASAHERKRNHGYYVSRAAKCQDVSDPERDLSFEAPDDCESNGEAKGAYVASVAQSDAGKKQKPERPGDE